MRITYIFLPLCKKSNTNKIENFIFLFAFYLCLFKMVTVSLGQSIYYCGCFSIFDLKTH